MTAAVALRRAHMSGIELNKGPEGGIAWEADTRPPEAVLSALRKHKDEIAELLELSAPWSPIDWIAHYTERAAIAEYDGGLTRQVAEDQAFVECVDEFVRQRRAMGSNPGDDMTKEAVRMLKRLGLGGDDAYSRTTRAGARTGHGVS